MAASRKPRAFVLISFEEEFDSVYNDLIKVPLERVGFEVLRADSRLDQRSILQDIFRGIADAELIVADLTGLNANVFYELGVAHTLAIPTILLTQNVEELPFDLRAYRANEYGTHFTEAPKLIQTLEEIGRGTLDGSISFSSPATDYLPPDFQRRPPAAPAAAIPPKEPDEEAGDEEAGAWFDAVREAQERNSVLLGAMTRINQATDAIGNQIERRTEELERVTALPESEQVKRATTLTLRVADELNKYASVLESEVPVFEENVALVMEPMSQYLSWLQAHPDMQAEDDLESLRQSSREFLDAMREALPTIREFRETVYGLRGFSRAINSASTRVAKSLDRFISGTETAEAEAARILTASEALQQGQVAAD